ncbi:MAG: hypothetical protein CMO55_11260 [Verrucomicrobiales bacterium]|nr:hypothetical protein [Verrucomicrobiales bacterium]
MMIPRFLLFTLLLTVATLSPAKDLFVNIETGDDANDGSIEKPFATGTRAVKAAESGDRIVLLPKKAVYYQTLDLRGCPTGVIIEGNGVTLSGAEPLDQFAWEKLENDLHRIRLPRTALDRHLLIVNGSAEGMGRQADPDKEFPNAQDLEPGEFRWELIDQKEGWLTVKGDTSNLQWVTRVNGLQTSGEIRNVKIFNLNARHFLNDGFNIHGDARGLQFFNITGYENFDEGFSAHDTCECWITEGTFYGNQNGIADVNLAETYYDKCYFHENIVYEVLFLGGRHSIDSSTILCSSDSIPLSIREGISTGETRTVAPAHLVMRNVGFATPGGKPNKVRFGEGSSIFIDRKTNERLEEVGYDVHDSATLSADLFYTYPIGRDADNKPIVAWTGGATMSGRGDSYRIVHFGKFNPEEVSEKLNPENDWMGLTTPLPSATYPPEGKAYSENSAAHAIWRWLGIMAPDAVFVPETPEGLALSQALQENPPAEVGMVDVFTVKENEAGGLNSTPLSHKREDVESARTEMLNRIERSPEELLEALAANYGNHFSGSYIEALALMVKIDQQVANNGKELAEKFLTDSPSLPNNPGAIAGTLLYTRFDEDWAKDRILAVADMAFDENGDPLECMPIHQEMSDSVFMVCPILAYAGKISGEKKYYEQCIRHLKFMQNMCLREDGLYRHSPLDEAAWGRGNGFPAFGLTLTLGWFPEEEPGHDYLVESLTAHLEALSNHQDRHGMWHQVIDHPDSYAEFTSTCMITYAISNAIEKGYLPTQPWASRMTTGWSGIKSRIGMDGLTLHDVCTGTGKQKTLEDYYDREAILGKDSRGGAMALLLASRMLDWYSRAKE